MREMLHDLVKNNCNSVFGDNSNEEETRKLLRDQRLVMLSDEVCCGSVSDIIEDFEIILSDGKKDPITLVISSNGGDLYSCAACIRMIRIAQKQGIKVIGDVRGHALSAAFLILQACDERRMGKLCMLMAHGATCFVVGDTKNIESENKMLEFYRKEFANLVAGRCKPKTKYSDSKMWVKMFKDATPQYFDSSEALSNGLVDIVE